MKRKIERVKIRGTRKRIRLNGNMVTVIMPPKKGMSWEKLMKSLEPLKKQWDKAHRI